MRYSILAATSLLLLAGTARGDGLWDVYAQSFAHARYIDLTHTIAPGIPVWRGFAPSAFAPTVDPLTGKPYTYKVDGFEASHYDLQTDQLGTQLDPRRIGRRNIPRSTNCRRPIRCARSSSSPSCRR